MTDRWEPYRKFTFKTEPQYELRFIDGYLITVTSAELVAPELMLNDVYGQHGYPIGGRLRDD